MASENDRLPHRPRSSRRLQDCQGLVKDDLSRVRYDLCFRRILRVRGSANFLIRMPALFVLRIEAIPAPFLKKGEDLPPTIPPKSAHPEAVLDKTATGSYR